MYVQVRPHRLTSHELEVVTWTEVATIEHVPRHEWECVGLRTETYATHPKLSALGHVYSCFHMIVMMKRLPAWFLWNVMLVLAIIVRGYVNGYEWNMVTERNCVMCLLSRGMKHGPRCQKHECVNI